MNWHLALSVIRSNNLKSMMAEMQQNVDPDDGTLDWMNPMIFGARANSEDTPTFGTSNELTRSRRILEGMSKGD